MTDNLVKRLRDPAFGTETTERNIMSAAADRIEELEENINLKAGFIDATLNQLAASDQRIEELEAKLAEYKMVASTLDNQLVGSWGEIADLKAKFEEAMQHVAEYSNDPHLVRWARTTLAELKGQTQWT